MGLVGPPVSPLCDSSWALVSSFWISLVRAAVTNPFAAKAALGLEATRLQVSPMVGFASFWAQAQAEMGAALQPEGAPPADYWT